MLKYSLEQLLAFVRGEMPKAEMDRIRSEAKTDPELAYSIKQAQMFQTTVGSGQTWTKEPEHGLVITSGGSGLSVVPEEEYHSLVDKYYENQESWDEIVKRQIKRAPWWMISVGMHAVLLFLTTLIIIETPRSVDESRRVIQAEMPAKVEKQYDPEIKRDIEENQKDIPVTDPAVTEKSEVIPLENVEISDHMEADTDSDFNEMLDADPDNKLLADRSGDVGSFTGIGIGGGSGGAFGTRGRGGRRWLTVKGGGSAKTESAVEAALQWLKRHHSMLADKNAEGKDMGFWYQRLWDMECADYGGIYAEPAKFPGKCPHNFHPKGAKGAGVIDFTKPVYLNPMGAPNDLASTGLALLTYAGAGYHHKRGKYKIPIQNAVSLVMFITKMADKFPAADIGKINSEDYSKIVAKSAVKHPAKLDWTTPGLLPGPGSVGMYQHNILTLGMLEIYGVSRDAYMKDACLALLRATVRAQKQNVTGGWRYDYADQSSDISLTTWGIMTVKAGKAVGLLNAACKAEGAEEETLFKTLKNWVDSCKSGENTYNYDPTGSNFQYEVPALGLADIAFLYSGDEMKKKMEPTVKAMSTFMLAPAINNKNFYLRLDNPDFAHENPATNSADIPDKQWLKFDYPDGMKVQLETNNGAQEVDLTTFQNFPKYTYSYNYPQYYMTLALFQYGGNAWKVWNHVNSRWLVGHQFQGKKQCADGSWECGMPGFVGYAESYGSVTLSTCFCALQLQVYYRYKKHSEENKEKDNKAKTPEKSAEKSAKSGK